jgi:hypothetical protein
MAADMVIAIEAEGRLPNMCKSRWTGPFPGAPSLRLS